MSATTEPHVCGLTPTQERLLLDAIKPERVSSRDGMSYVEAWDDRRHLNRIFGFTGWSETCLSEECVYFDAHPQRYKRGHAKAGQEIPGSVCYTAVYKYGVHLAVKCRCGAELKADDAYATGDGINMPQPGDAHDFAIKTAASQALKRAAINLGDQFGLSLYNSGSTNAVVIGTAFTMEENAMKAAEAKVIGGEMDDQPDSSADQYEDPAKIDVPQAAFDALKEPGPGNYKDRQPGQADGATLAGLLRMVGSAESGEDLDVIRDTVEAAAFSEQEKRMLFGRVEAARTRVGAS